MLTHKQALVASAAALSLFMLTVPAYAQGQSKPDKPLSPQDVNVVNTPSVSVVNADSAPIPITGTTSVGASGERALLVRDADNPALQPIQGFFVFIAGLLPAEPYTVPAGKRLVIEYVSGELINSTTCTSRAAGLFTTVASGGVQTSVGHRFPLTATATPLLSVFGQQTRLYAEPGTNVTASSLGISNTGNCEVSSYTIIFSGHLLNVP